MARHEFKIRLGRLAQHDEEWGSHVVKIREIKPKDPNLILTITSRLHLLLPNKFHVQEVYEWQGRFYQVRDLFAEISWLEKGIMPLGYEFNGFTRFQSSVMHSWDGKRLKDKERAYRITQTEINASRLLICGNLLLCEIVEPHFSIEDKKLRVSANKIPRQNYINSLSSFAWTPLSRLKDEASKYDVHADDVDKFIGNFQFVSSDNWKPYFDTMSAEFSALMNALEWCTMESRSKHSPEQRAETSKLQLLVESWTRGQLEIRDLAGDIAKQVELMESLQIRSWNSANVYLGKSKAIAEFMRRHIGFA